MSDALFSITAPSRLHFGLLATRSQKRRSYGGAGLMIEAPGLKLTARIANEIRVIGNASKSLLERATRIVRRLISEVHSGNMTGVSIDIKHAPDEHTGLGTGTQLSLALATALDRLAGKNSDPGDLAAVVGRGARSAIGIHGFANGGFLIDGGKHPASESVAPLIVRWEFPLEWPILLLRPGISTGLSGSLEDRAMAEADLISPETTDRLARLLLLAVLPALAERDYRSFADSLVEYNRTVGECFAKAQGAAYADAQSCAIVDWAWRLRRVAIGQSSWGPTLYLIAPDADGKQRLQDELTSKFGIAPDAMLWTQARNTGAWIEERTA